MKSSHPTLLRITAIFLIAFILGGYFSMVSRFLGEAPNIFVQYLFAIGILGSFVCGISWCLLELWKKLKKK